MIKIEYSTNFIEDTSEWNYEWQITIAKNYEKWKNPFDTKHCQKVNEWNGIIKKKNSLIKRHSNNLSYRLSNTYRT